MPKPSIIRSERGMARSDMANISMWVLSGMSGAQSQNVSWAPPASGTIRGGGAVVQSLTGRFAWQCRAEHAAGRDRDRRARYVGDDLPGYGFRVSKIPVHTAAADRKLPSISSLASSTNSFIHPLKPLRSRAFAREERPALAETPMRWKLGVLPIVNQLFLRMCGSWFVR
jgi:hypothetical protein